MNPSTKRFRLPAFVAMFAVGIIMVFGTTGHACHLHSPVVAIPLLIIAVWAGYVWTVCAKTGGQAWLRMGMAFLLAIALEMTYLTWLHSDFFPRALLSPSARQREEELDGMPSIILRDLQGDDSLESRPEKQ